MLRNTLHRFSVETVNIFDCEQNVIFYSFDKKLLVVHLSQGSGKRETGRLRHQLPESHPNASGRQAERK